MRRVTRSVGDKNSIKMMGDFVNTIVIGENGDTSPSPYQAAKNIFFHTAIDDSNVQIAIARTDMEWCLGADFADQIDLLWINEGFTLLDLIRIILLANGNTGQRRTLFSQICDYGTSIHCCAWATDKINPVRGFGLTSGYCRHSLPCTPFAEALNSSPVTILFRHIRHHYPHSLQMRRFKVSQQPIFITSWRWHSIIANKRLCEDENLATIRWVGQWFWVTNQRSGEYGFTGNVQFGPERLAAEYWSILPN